MSPSILLSNTELIVPWKIQIQCSLFVITTLDKIKWAGVKCRLLGAHFKGVSVSHLGGPRACFSEIMAGNVFKTNMVW